MASDWPTATLAPQSILFALKNRSTSGGPSVTGIEQIVKSRSAVWRAQITTKINSTQQALAYRALMAQSDGRAGLWLVPPCAARPKFDISSFQVFSTFGDGATFSDGSRFFFNVTTSSLLNATTLTSGTIGVQVLSIIASDATPPVAGQYFSAGERLYLIASVSRTLANTYSIQFRPGLRDPVAIGDVLEFETPKCRMRLATDETGDMNLDLLRFAPVTVEFIEAI